jgi:Bacteriophage replication gene A protein (GPA)
VTDWRKQKRRTREFLKGLELEDEEGNRISLIDEYDGSVANQRRDVNLPTERQSDSQNN